MKKVFGTISLIVIITFGNISLYCRDYLLPKEDRLLRKAETIDAKTSVLLKAADRRLVVLQFRCGKFSQKGWLNRLKKDHLLSKLLDMDIESLMKDYSSCMRSLLMKVEGAFLYDRSSSMAYALWKLKKQSSKMMKILNGVKKCIPSREKVQQTFTEAIALTQSAKSGAEKGLKLIH